MTTGSSPKSTALIYPALPHAVLAGWRASMCMLAEQPFRRHFVRPALPGENSRQYQGSFPDEIVCVRLEWLDRPTFAQLIVGAPKHIVDFFRTDRGEDTARLTFEFADDSPRLARRDLISPVDATPRILGITTYPGTLPPCATWIVAQWHPEGHTNREWLRLAELERAAT